MPRLADILARRSSRSTGAADARRGGPPANAWLLVLVTLLFGIVAVVLNTLLYRAIHTELQTRRFPTTEGTITYSRFQQERGRDGWIYSADIQFQYQVDGRTHHSGDWRRGSTSGSSRSEFNAVVRRFPVGAETAVYYDPANPARALLLHGDLNLYMFLAMMLNAVNGFVLIFVLAVVQSRLAAWRGPGGLRVRETIHGPALRFGRFTSAFITAMIVIFISALIGMLLVLGLTSMENARYALAAQIALGLLAFAAWYGWSLRRPVDLLINSGRSEITLPVAGHCQPIGFDQIIDIDARHLDNVKSGTLESSSSGTIFSDRVQVTYRDLHGREQTARLPVLATSRQAIELAEHLRRQTGVRRPSPRQPGDMR